MKPRIAVALVLLVFAPLAALSWLGARFARSERERFRARIESAARELLETSLASLDERIAEAVRGREREMLELFATTQRSPEDFRAAARAAPFVRTLFLWDESEGLLCPNPAGELTADEQGFLRRTEEIWRPGAFEAPADEPAQTAPSLGTLKQARGPAAQGWRVWFWGAGPRWIFWLREAPGRYIGAEVEEARLLAEVIGLLPGSALGSEDGAAARLAVLADSNGRTLYRWGGYTPPPGEPPLASLRLGPPFEAWRLDSWLAEAAPTAVSMGPFYLNLGAAGAACAIALIGLGIYLYRESARELREAARRVTFVNQVSHELKTPLTNVRMYAEMLEASLDESDEKARRRAAVIVQEGQRLSRLIANILTFSRRQRGQLALRHGEGDIDETIQRTLDQFAPALRARGIAVRFDGQAKGPARFDSDALEQIVGNLISNVEKYAAQGGELIVESRRDGAEAFIVVADQGPGVPPAQRERVFLPFVRLGGELTEGATGTGIGLAIARDLARMHGGDLRLAPSERGARFELTLRLGEGEKGR